MPMLGSISTVYQECVYPDAEFPHYDAEVVKAKLAKVGHKDTNENGIVNFTENGDDVSLELIF